MIYETTIKSLSRLNEKFRERSFIKGIGGEDIPPSIQRAALNNAETSGHMNAGMRASISHKIGLGD